VISRRSVVKKKTSKIEEEAEAKAIQAAPSIQIVQDQSGETVEQKVIKGGLLRRRRVEPVPEPVTPELKPVVEEAPAENDLVVSTVELTSDEATIESHPEETQADEIADQVETVSEVAEEAVEEVPEVIVEEPSPSDRPTIVEVKPSDRPATGGRDLSAPRRLKVVGTSTPPKPAEPRQRSDLAKTRGGATTGTAGAAKSATAKPAIASPRVGAPEEEAGDDAAKLKEAAKKKAAASLKNWELPRVTKKDLLGMTEEVEITRPLSRRTKKVTVRSDKKPRITTPSQQKRRIKITGSITVADLADRMGLKAVELVRKLIAQGQMVSASQLIDFDTATLIASDYGYEIVNVEETAESLISLNAEPEEELDDTARQPRPAVVTIMGHVDHGKTSLLDYIRKTRVAAKEAGGITQHIGAYQVAQAGKFITFLDTPGHEAFTKMRARGASVTDIVILVVAADEGVKPQTLEALAHAKAAKVPVIVAVNKMDKPEANPDRVMQELSGHELVPEAWGGDTIFAKVSAQTGEGIDQLLEMILLQAEVLDLKANPDRPGRGIIVESRLDKGRGPVATAVITNGTLRAGDPIVCGSAFGKVRALFDDMGVQIKEAGPSKPIEILGFDIVPEVGINLTAVTDETVARRASELSSLARKEEESRKSQRLSLEDMFSRMKAGEVNELRIVLKADVQGSMEALADSLEKIKHDEVKVNVIYKAVGGISESDVSLAAASGALIFGFNVRPSSEAKELASRENVQIKSYGVIYELLDDVKAAMEGLLAPEIKETLLGQAEVREVFSLSKAGQIAGCFVKSGKIQRNKLARLIRNSVVIYEDKVSGLKRFKEDTREVAEGFECGIKLENYNDIKVDDVIECFDRVELARAVG